MTMQLDLMMNVASLLRRLEAQFLRRRVQTLERELLIAKLEARRDPMTGILNRRALMERIVPGKQWWVLMDLDNFKRAQDGHPLHHLFGDDVLRQFSRFLVDSCRATTDDAVGFRSGGDEFVVLCSSELGARAVAARLAPWERNGVTLSLGIGRDQAAAESELCRAKELKKLPGANLPFSGGSGNLRR